MIELLEKESFLWISESQSVFESLKREKTETPVLKLPDFTKQFVIQTDASGYDMGAVLTQNGHLISFF